MLRLQLRSDPARYAVLSSSVTLGSDDGNDFVIESRNVSDFHAEIRIENRAVYIVDLLSAGGTFINDRRIGQPMRLQAWDVVRLGDVELEVCDPASRRPGDWALRTESDLLARQFYPLQEETVLGRGADCDLRIESQLLSRRHARLLIEGDHLRVIDLESTNGTFINGERVTDGTAVPGDELRFDKHSFIVEGPRVAATADHDQGEKTLLRDDLGGDGPGAAG